MEPAASSTIEWPRAGSCAARIRLQIPRMSPSTILWDWGGDRFQFRLCCAIKIALSATGRPVRYTQTSTQPAKKGTPNVSQATVNDPSYPSLSNLTTAIFLPSCQGLTVLRPRLRSQAGAWPVPASHQPPLDAPQPQILTQGPYDAHASSQNS